LTYHIKEIADALFHSIGIILSYYEKNGSISVLTETDIDTMLLFHYSRAKRVLENSRLAENQPIFISNDINCSWLVIRLEKEEGTFVAGPVLVSAVSSEMVFKHYRLKGLAWDEADKLAEEYKKIPIVPYPMLVKFHSFIHNMLVGNKPDSVRSEASGTSRKTAAVKRNEEEIYQIQKRNFMLSKESEAYILDIIRKGDIDRLENRNYDALKELTSLGNSEIRSLKNNFITAITLFTRAAIEGGLAVEIAYPMSDRYILQLEAATEVVSVIEVYNEALQAFTTSIKNNHFIMDYSQVVNKCCGFIMANLNKPINLVDVAEIAGMNPDYLSRRFKKETGKSVTEYIRQVKIEEAKMLLLHSDAPLTEIAFLLGYSNQGRFIEAFKREAGTTPNKFRQNEKKKQKLHSETVNYKS